MPNRNQVAQAGFDLHRYHERSLSLLVALVLFCRQSMQDRYLFPTVEDQKSTSLQTMSVGFVLEALASRLLPLGLSRHTEAHDEPGVTWSADTSDTPKRRTAENREKDIMF